MKTIEVRPPGGGIPITIRNNKKLQTLQAEAERLRETVRKLEVAITNVERERQQGDQTPLMDTITRAQWEVKRVELKTQYDRADRELGIARSQLKVAECEHGEWVENFTKWEIQSKQLQRELANAPDHQFDMVMTSTGEAPPRSKEVVERELLEVTKMLAAFSDDAELMREFQELEKRILSTKPYVVLTTDYVCTGTGEIISQTELQERACKLGSDVACRGATSSPYRKGARIPREEAARLGLS